MIDDIMRFLTTALNEHLTGVLGRSSEPYAVMSTLANLDGTPAKGIEQCIIFTLVNIERETAAGAAVPRTIRPAATGVDYIRVASPINLNLYVLMSAHHSRYAEALKRLSLALGFVQTNPSFDATVSSDLPDGVDRLGLELASVDFQTLNNLWAVCGTKHLPSVLLKVRMVTIDARRAEQRVPAIRGLDPDIGTTPGAGLV
jgi:hypothetical protein